MDSLQAAGQALAALSDGEDDQIEAVAKSGCAAGVVAMFKNPNRAVYMPYVVVGYVGCIFVGNIRTATGRAQGFASWRGHR